MKPPELPRNYVLLVEDNYNDELLTRRAFAKIKLADRLMVVRDGVEALEYLLGAGERPRPALVLLDLKLPRLDGLEVLRRLRGDDRTRRLPVVMLTSSDEEGDKQEGMQGGLDGYIRKPVDFCDFVEIIRQLGLSWLQLDASFFPGTSN